MLDALKILHGANDRADWTDPTGSVGHKLDELASKTLTAQAGLTDNALIRADGTTGRIQDSQVILSDSGAMTEVLSVKGEEGSSLTVSGAAGAATSNGSNLVLEGGDGGSTSGDGGVVNITGGSVDGGGNGGNINLVATAGVGTNKDGGDVQLTAGAATGSGTPGTIVLISDTVFNEAGADKDFRIESNGDANNLVSDGGTNRIGIGMLSPNEKLQVTDAIALSNNTEGNTGRLTRRTSHETHTLAAASTSDTTTISIPSGARLLGVSMNVDTEVAHSGIGNQWAAAFITGSTTTLTSVSAGSQNTKLDFIVPDDEKTSAIAEIRFTAGGGGTFSAGVIEVVAYYEELTSLADV